MLAAVPFPGDRHKVKKEAEFLKIQSPHYRIQHMWNWKAKVIPAIVIGATGTISESLRQYLSNVTGKHEIKEIQKQPHWALHTYYRKY
jgi:hypothetical protein